MNDLLYILIKAKQSHIFCTENDFIKSLDELREYDEKLKLDWDDGAGEEWARLTHENHGIVYMINSKIGIIFARKSYKDRIPDKILSKYEIYITESYDKNEWCVDLKKLKREVPQIAWHASEDAVNYNSFSLNELYFATV